MLASIQKNSSDWNACIEITEPIFSQITQLRGMKVTEWRREKKKKSFKFFLR